MVPELDDKIKKTHTKKSFHHYTDFLTTSWVFPDFSEEIKSNSYKDSVIEPFPLIQSSCIIIDVGNKFFEFPRELKKIANQIEDAKEILSYTYNWDEEGGEPTNEKTFLNAITFLYIYAKYISDVYGVIIEAPYIDIMKDGSIYIKWSTVKASFLIIFKKSNHPNAYFFGEKKENEIPFKSAVEIGKPIDETIAVWMKNNLA